ncbi:hypothetical protein R5R35_005610 [Gryllus longicercus]|uniref:Peptidase S1 domain-containing protein n=1 Tax=Gryllus longicercus TaxID=2509291 RepID=A0AAN9V2J2_9ORTH
MTSLRVRQLAPPATIALLLAVVAGSFAFPGQDADFGSEGIRVKRVAGGQKVEVTVVPYQAKIEHPNGICGATIIHPSFVLTAKHCVKGNAKEMRVTVGAPSSRGRPPVVRMVRRVLAFPDKAQLDERRRWLPRDVPPTAVMGDIALVQVDPPFPTDRDREIRLVELQTQRGIVANCVLSGWGYTKTNDDSPSRLRAAVVEVFPRDKCLRLEKRLKQDYICAGQRGGGVDACDGDSGGPLVCGGRLTGVVKGGRGCGESMQVTKYTEVALYARWVASKVEEVEETRLGFARKGA